LFSYPYVLPSGYTVVFESDSKGVTVVAGKRELGRVPWTSFKKVDGLTGEVPPRATAAPTTLTVSNDADVFALSCDDRFAVVGGANSATPVSVLDFEQAREVFTLPVPNRLARSVSIGDDGADRAAGGARQSHRRNYANSVRRLDSRRRDTGALADSGEEASDRDPTTSLESHRVARGNRRSAVSATRRHSKRGADRFFFRAAGLVVYAARVDPRRTVPANCARAVGPAGD
jgi:hypothetical protein